MARSRLRSAIARRRSPDSRAVTREAERAAGPIERIDAPEKLSARVVEPGESPRILGYAAFDDLAPNYSFAEIVLLSLGGTLPEPHVGRAFEIALAFAAPVSAAEAPANAAGLARLCGAPPKNVVAVGAVVLAEHAGQRIDALRDLLRWLEDQTTAFPATASAPHAPSIEMLRRALPPPFSALAVFQHSPSLDAALVAVLFACGLRRPDRLVAALTLAGLGCTWAEAFAVKALNLRGYPMDVPPFEYMEEK